VEHGKIGTEKRNEYEQNAHKFIVNEMHIEAKKFSENRDNK